jgi:filamentous hemagglutinin
LDSTDQDQDDEFEFTVPRFASERDLAIHFKLHGQDFGATTPSEYEGQATCLLTAQGNPDILQVTRAGGNIVRFNPMTDEFGVLTRTAILKHIIDLTQHYMDNPTNLDYFYAQ